MRVVFSANGNKQGFEELEEKFALTAKKFNMDWKLYDSAHKMRLLLMVSKQGHCLNDLLHRYASGSLPVEIPAVISNHKDMEQMVINPCLSKIQKRRKKKKNILVILNLIKMSLRLIL